jgi:hypothetical protein
MYSAICLLAFAGTTLPYYPLQIIHLEDYNEDGRIVNYVQVKFNL